MKFETSTNYEDRNVSFFVLRICFRFQPACRTGRFSYFVLSLEKKCVHQDHCESTIVPMHWKEFASHIRYLTTTDLKRVEQGFLLGEKVHKGQKRKSGEPYWSHPIAVANMLADMQADADTIIAALLHDTLEDTPLTLADIEREFDHSVPALIDGVTKLTTAELPAKPTLNEQIETLRKMFTLMQADIRIMVIKLIDRLHNIQTAEYLEPERQLALAQETMDVYVKIADRLSMLEIRKELEGLSLQILKPDLWTALTEHRTRMEQDAKKTIATLNSTLVASEPALMRGTEIVFEAPTWEKLERQHAADGSVVSGIATFTAVFICHDRASCYRILGTLHEHWQREVMSFQDYINAQMINGYQGLHTTVILQDGTRVRCKIRTREMHEYAEKGISTLCFKKHGQELLDALPWMKRIAPLSADTIDRSDEFWQNLQSDILGESMTIHGPADQTALVPKNATALDGAFYLFGNEALRTKSILINGRELPLQTELNHADSIEITQAESQRVDRSWLDFVRTGLATAKIRDAITDAMSEEEMVTLGKQMLQELLTLNKQGFVEEFNEKEMLPQLNLIGYTSLADAYRGISKGRVKPHQVYDALFRPRLNIVQKSGVRRHCVVRCTVERDDTETLHRLLNIYEKYRTHQKNLRIWPLPYSSSLRIAWSLWLTESEEGMLKQEIMHGAGKDIEVIVYSKREALLIAAVIIPWALNPVWAKWFLFHGLTPLHLLTIRFITFAAFAVLFFIGWRSSVKTKFSPPERSLLKAATIPSILNAGLSILTYLTLALIPASIHLTILRFNTLLISALGSKPKIKSMITLGIFILAIFCTIALFALTTGYTLIGGLALSLATLLFYTSYSLSAEHTLQQHKIGIRYPFLLLSMGLLLGIVGLLLLPSQGAAIMHSGLLLQTIAYVLICVCVPHTCYSALLKITRFKNITNIFLLEVPLAIIFEILILGTFLPLGTYMVIAIILGFVLIAKNRSVIPQTAE